MMPTLNAVDPNLIMATVEGDPYVAFIPNDEGNKDWREYQAWLTQGNEPNPPQGVPTPPVEPIPPPDIHEVNAQVQDIDARLSALEADLGR